VDPALFELIDEGSPDDEVAVLLRLADPTAAPPDVRLVAQFGNIATCRLRRADILAVRAAAPVRSMKAREYFAPSWLDEEGTDDEESSDDLDPTEAIDVWIDDGEALPAAERESDQRRPDIPGLPTGKGVVVAHIDWGIDIAHPAFRNPDGTTRLLALWDQRGSAFADRPNRYGYGRIFDRDDINRALRSRDPYASLNYYPFDFDTSRGTHGAHTVSISAGSAEGAGPPGIAPESDIIFCHLSTYTDEGPTNLGDSVAYVEAIDFIVRTATEAYSADPMPLEGDEAGSAEKDETAREERGPLRGIVVNSSLGRHGGPHVGLTLVEQGLDAALRGTVGLAFVHSAGNYYNRHIHAAGTLRPGETHTVRLRVPAGGRRDEFRTFNTTHVEFWYPGTDRIAVVVTAPDGTRFPPARGDEQHDLLLPGGEGQLPREIGRLYHRLSDPNTGDNEAALFLDPGAPAGIYELTVLGEDIADGRYHFWVERNPAGRRAQGTFDPRDSRPETTTGTICNGFRTIAVGAYDGHAWHESGNVPESGRPLAPFSSSGPTRDGRQKPDLCAPGVQVLAARSCPKRWPGQEAGRPPPLLSRMSGTSMAAPHVTGTIALMFEAATIPLAIEDIRRLLLAHTDPLPDDAPLEIRRRIGSGFLNIPAAVDAARTYQPAVAHAVYVSRVALQPPRSAMVTESSQLNVEGLAAMSGTDDSFINAEHDISESEADELTEADIYPPYDADEAFGDDEGDGDAGTWEMDADEATRRQRDERRSALRRRGSTPPFSFVVPLGGGGITPALTVPVGGAQSPFAFAVPLTSPPAPAAAPVAPVAGVPVMPVMPVAPAPPFAGSDQPIAVAEPVDPALLVAGMEDPNAFLAGGGEKELAGGWLDFGEADPTILKGDSFGERLVTAADALAAEPEIHSARSAAILTALLATAAIELDFGPEGAPSATTLFNTFALPARNGVQRPGARQTLQRHFEPVALPGARLQPEDLRSGDLLVRVARGEQWGHISIVMTPHILSAAEVGRERSGGYVRVIEWAPVARRRDEQFARRVADEHGNMLPEALVLRIRDPQESVTTSTLTQESDSWSAWGEAVVHTSDLSDAFFASMHVVAASLGTQAEYLLAVMNSESGIRANAHNRNGNASGLIQFMPATLVRLGWTNGHEAFRRLSAEEQLPFVERYYRPFVPQGLNSTARLYQATFLPATLNRGSAPETVIVDVNNNDNAFAYGPNRGLDRRGDGRILVGDLTAFVDRAKRSPRWAEALQRLNATVPGPLPVPPPGPHPVPPLPVPPMPPGPVPASRPLLRRGARGQAVREAQMLLNTVHMRNVAAGRPPLRGAPLEIDGAFGPRTFAAVVAFQQQAFPSTPAEWDGVIGPRTWAHLEAAATGGAPGGTASPSMSTPVPNGGTATEEYSPWERYAYWEQLAEQAPAINWCQIRQQITAVARGEDARWTRPNNTKFLESHPSRLPILEEYWRATPGFGNPATALNAARRSAANDPDFPWSAAFICFVMRRAGVQRQHGFEFSQRHMNFIVGALRNRERGDRNRPFWLIDSTELQNEVTLAPGDLLCFNRCRPQAGARASRDCPAGQVMTTHSYTSLRREFWEGGNDTRDVFGHSHTAIIVGTTVRNGQRFIETIGGNEGDSVRLDSTIPLNASGGISNPGGRHLFGAIKLIECT
jgi:subtilisin family serine protease